ncbi:MULTISPECIES: RagB/SusD family nutrient uptake outer membrane protein [Rufibacter]|uniref:RagB/SusD family nutrient uptake outer membrane protein n=1 Tax=Rufibacter quisquiliarum TaxID=1549639 RepID=A0A839GMV3_9BACT|nr:MULTISPECIES: RagB/SusD family nutrient uptake outer membrane protein [Rufibacter]MBA9076257.1 hypothetical protein [Rufibacter quisquiliarum]
MKNLKYRFYLLLAFAVMLTSCSDDFLDTFPTDKAAESTAFESTKNARVALNGIYSALYKQQDGSQTRDGYTSMMIYIDFMGEDIVHSASGTTYFRNAHRWTDHRSETGVVNEWAYRFYYRIIANTNLIINNIDEVPGDIKDKNAIKGEALALRAWAHFNVVQLYGIRYDKTNTPNAQLGVPIMTQNSVEPQARATVEEVYAQVNTDLDQALSLLVSTNEPSNKTHLHLKSVKGIKARVALTMQDWDNAAKYAAEAREGYTLMTNAEYLSGFNNMGSGVVQGEWMWGARQLDTQVPTYGGWFVYMSSNVSSSHTRPNPKKINTKLYNALASTDVRKKLWWNGTAADAVNFPGVINAATGQTDVSAVRRAYMHKKFVTANPAVASGDIPFMRAAEMYLIEAEAHARAGRSEEAQTALFPLAVNRNPSYVKSTKTGADLIEEIMIQRRVELWGEGFRFTDLKRTNSELNRSGTGATSALATTGVTTPVPAGDIRWQFRFPREEMNVNPNLIQNP